MQRVLVLALLPVFIAPSLARADAAADVDAGVAAYNRGDNDTAIHYYTQALQEGGLSLDDQVIVYNNRGNAYERKSDYDKAIADFTEAIRLNATDPKSYYNRAKSYRRKQDYAAAMADENEALRLEPGNGDAYNGRGLIYDAMGDYDKALADYAQAIRLNPEDSYAYNNRGNIYAHQKKFGLAIADYTDALRRKPDDFAAYLGRAEAYEDTRQYDKALSDLDDVLRLSRDDANTADALFDRANIYLAKKLYDAAISDYTQTLKLRPADLYARANRGEAYEHQLKHAQALIDYSAALDLHPADADDAAYILRGVARVYLYMMQYDISLVEFENAIEDSPGSNDSLIWHYLAMRKAGRSGLADLRKSAGKLHDKKSWPYPVVNYYLGAIDADGLFSAAKDVDQGVQSAQFCAADVYVGENALLQGNKIEAKRFFDKARQECPGDVIELALAEEELRRLAPEPDKP